MKKVKGDICSVRFPKTILSDNGTQFTVQKFEKYIEQHQIKYVKKLVYHPQSNGRETFARYGFQEPFCWTMVHNLRRKNSKNMLSDIK
jgi:transposase InsO family protein